MLLYCDTLYTHTLTIYIRNMLQVIDRHIGIIYKRAVYRAMRAEYMRLYHEALKTAEVGASIEIPPLT